MSATSQSAALVWGVAALMLQADSAPRSVCPPFAPGFFLWLGTCFCSLSGSRVSLFGGLQQLWGTTLMGEV